MYAVERADAGEGVDGVGAAGEILRAGVTGGKGLGEEGLVETLFGFWEFAGPAGYVEEVVGLIVVAEGGRGGDGVGNPF